MIRLDLIALDIGLERPDRPREGIADAPEPYGVERYIEHVSERLDVRTPRTVERA